MCRNQSKEKAVVVLSWLDKCKTVTKIRLVNMMLTCIM
jgi:hypothetical protein